ncbi:MAG: hypothetical protein RBT42_11975 [Aquabacterium sp.]|jgi:hypothetical protein|uniref:hypothetical protein n=1 Tax=Aquabacterium sp. TaxID=1872578 RepID=UPI002A3610DD|nr:hypothetical protein [Aquabacterium sp.]MDX9844463.1 hypothetical protein [Aquabacterium sp.]
MFTQYKGVASIFKAYWTTYGGLSALLCSPYLHFAVLLLALTPRAWTGWGCDGLECTQWWEQSISVLPNLLGFTLGGFAIFIGFGDEKFRALLAEDDEHSSVNAYVALCSTFVHFILIQALALIVAIVAKSWWFYTPLLDSIRSWLPFLNGVGGAFGYGLFLYAITSVLAATMHIFRIAKMYALFQAQSQKATNVNAPDEPK